MYAKYNETILNNLNIKNNAIKFKLKIKKHKTKITICIT